ncbi:MAG: LysM peptidoglycan-binding domain-containing protein [Clostridia bacterium]
MSSQNELLTFTIKETIFLTTDRAGIREMKEMELLPNVEIIENEAGVSIAGYLLLHAKYDPFEQMEEEWDAGTGATSLVDAMKFTPYRLEHNDSNHDLYHSEHDFSHRIPVSISIPSSRIREKHDLFAVVNQFDYQVVSTNQLVVQAELKIAGLELYDAEERQFGDMDAALEAETFPIAHEEDEEQMSGEKWEFVHIANEDASYEPSSLDEIENKLMQLEQEIALQQYHQQQQSPYYPSSQSPNPPYMSPSPYAPEGFFSYPSAQEPHFPVMADADSHTYGRQQEVKETDVHPYAPRFGDITPYSEDDEIHNVGFEEDDHEADEIVAEVQPASIGEQNKLEATVESQALETFVDSEPEAAAEVETVAESKADTDAEAQSEAEEVANTDVEAEAMEAMAFPEEAAQEQEQEQESLAMASEENQAEPEASASGNQEVKVAIGSKGSTEKEESLNLTNLFTARRESYSEREHETESASSGSRGVQAMPEVSRSTLDAVNSLSSVARVHGDNFSKLKVCIIQRNDTLETIAARYSLPVSKLMEANRLSTDRVAAGQILYIPQ